MNLYVKASLAYTDHKSAANAYARNSKHKEAEGLDESKALISYPNDTVEISQAARTAANAKKKLSNMYAAFFPTRDKEGATALAEAVINPAANSFSKSKTITQIADEAREELDAGYIEMRESGEKFDADKEQDVNSLFKNLSRRALYAVKNNEGEQFSIEESELAEKLMGKQERLATGYYTGGDEYADPYAGDEASRVKAYAEYLSLVSPEEKSSQDWAHSMNAAQTLYGFYLENGDKEDETPLLKALLRTDDEEIEAIKARESKLEQKSA